MFSEQLQSKHLAFRSVRTVCSTLGCTGMHWSPMWPACSPEPHPMVLALCWHSAHHAGDLRTHVRRGGRMLSTRASLVVAAAKLGEQADDFEV